MVSFKKVVYKLFRYEIHSSKLLPCHDNWRAFTYTPWLPYKLPHQLLYIAYRWALVVYFFIWLIMAGRQGEGSYFIYLTNWAHLLYNAYLIVSALSTTITVAKTHCTERQQSLLDRDYLNTTEPDGYWDISNNTLSWYQMIHWVFYTIGNEFAFCVMILYWTLIYRGGTVDGVNANTHLLNGILSLVDMWVSGLPVNLLHFVYIMALAVAYSTFSGIYFIASGRAIYPGVLDYDSSPGAAVGLYLGLTFVLLPVLHSLLYLMYLGKQWVVYHSCAVRHVKMSGGFPSSADRRQASLELTDMHTDLSNDSDDLSNQ